MSLLDELQVIRNLDGILYLAPKIKSTKYEVEVSSYPRIYYIQFMDHELKLITENKLSDSVYWHDLSLILSRDEEFKNKLEGVIRAMSL